MAVGLAGIGKLAGAYAASTNADVLRAAGDAYATALSVTVGASAVLLLAIAGIVLPTLRHVPTNAHGRRQHRNRSIPNHGATEVTAATSQLTEPTSMPEQATTSV